MNTNYLKGTLLIVDDVPDNIFVLMHFLTNSGHNVLIAEDGEQGIRAAQTRNPDLILLDIMMPGIDGFEVCRHLKSQESTRNIPIIFMTALADTSDKLKGFELGAADYITKPIQHKEVLARVNTHLTLHRQRQELRKQRQELQEANDRLKEEIHLREQAQFSLEEANNILVKRNQELDAFAHTVARDLKEPLGAIISATELLLVGCSANQLVNARHIDKIRWLTQAEDKMSSIIDQLLLLSGVSRKTKIDMQPLNMSEILAQVLARIESLLKKYAGEIAIPSTSWPIVQGHAPWVIEVWVNYLTNAIKYGGRPPRLEIGATPQNDNMIKFWVKDNGVPLSLETRTQLFTPFSHLPEKQAKGLGLSIVRQIIERLGGTVGVDSGDEQGNIFYFTLSSVF